MAKKLILDSDEETWKKVKKYMIDNNLPDLNSTVNILIKRGLKL